MKSTANIFNIILPLRLSRKATVALALLALSTLNPRLSTVLAQGTAFSYQGRLTDGGSPANGSYDLTFALFNASSAGSQAGNTITNAGMGVTNGLFTVLLDFGNPFNGTPYWLEIGVRAGGGGAFTPLSPRQALTPTPYALYAPSAGTAAIATVANSTAPNAVNGASLQSNSITSDKILVGTITDADISTGGISGNKIIGGDLQAQRLMVGASHTLAGQFATIAGGFQNTISNAGWSTDAIGGGNLNQINSAGDAAIAGGYGNGISNSWASTVAGGNGNLVTGQSAAAIGGGGQNQIVGAGAATIAGGYQNAISNAAFSGDAIGGGQGNQIRSAGSAAIAGGYQNAVSNSWAAAVAGGAGNLVAGSGNAAIGGGLNNNLNSAWCGTIPGGRSNQVSGTYGFAAGYRAKANHPGAFVWGDSTEADFASSGNDQFLIRAAGGVGIGKTNPATALDVNGTVTAIAFLGNGAGLAGLNASQLTSGTVPPANLPVPLQLSGTNSGAVISGTNAYGPAVSGTGGSTGVSGTGYHYGLYGCGSVYGLYAYSTGNNGYGVYGSGDFSGVYAAGNLYGVVGAGGAYGLYGTGGSYGVGGSGSSYGVYGSGSNGVYGVSSVANGAGVSGSGLYGIVGTSSPNGIAVLGNGGSYGVVGSGITGVYGFGSTGVYGGSTNANGIGVYGSGFGSVDAGGAYAGVFSGDVRVSGNLYVSQNYWVGIGTDPYCPLDVNGGGGWGGTYGYLNSSGDTGTATRSLNYYSIRAWDRIAASEFNAFSDGRIKQVIGRSDTGRDLETVRQLQVTEYRHIDAIAKGTGVKKGFIAQEVSDFIPEAVTASPNFIPSIYALATEVEFDAGQRTLALALAKPHELVVGDKVRLYIATKMVERTVTGIPSERQFVVSDWDEAADRVFVYGKYVTDFLSLDYDRLFTTGIGAIQELAKQAEAREARITQLEADVAELKTLVNTLAAKADGGGQ